METVGERIKRLRERKDLTQKELADLIDITEASLSRYENNLRSPRATILSRMAKALDTTSDYIMTAFIPEEYKQKHSVSRRDISQYDAFMQSASTFFMNDEVAEEDKEALFRDITELFWKAKEMNKGKYGKPKK